MFIKRLSADGHPLKASNTKKTRTSVCSKIADIKRCIGLMRDAYKRGSVLRAAAIKAGLIGNVSTAALSLRVQSAHGETAIINREQAWAWVDVA